MLVIGVAHHALDRRDELLRVARLCRDADRIARHRLREEVRPPQRIDERDPELERELREIEMQIVGPAVTRRDDRDRLVQRDQPRRELAQRRLGARRLAGVLEQPRTPGAEPIVGQLVERADLVEQLDPGLLERALRVVVAAARIGPHRREPRAQLGPLARDRHECPPMRVPELDRRLANTRRVDQLGDQRALVRVDLDPRGLGERAHVLAHAGVRRHPAERALDDDRAEPAVRFLAARRRDQVFRVLRQALRRQRAEQRELDEHRVLIVRIALQLVRALGLTRALEALRRHRRGRLVRHHAADLLPERRQELWRRARQCLRDLLERLLRVTRLRLHEPLRLANVLGDVEGDLGLLRFVDERPRRKAERAVAHLAEVRRDLRRLEAERGHLGIGPSRDGLGLEPHDHLAVERGVHVRARSDRTGPEITCELRAERGDPAGGHRRRRIMCDERLSHRSPPSRARASRRCARPSACPPRTR